jgi:hypothetical protein
VKASELIATLSALVAEHGDLPVFIPEYGDEGQPAEAESVILVPGMRTGSWYNRPAPRHLYLH